MRAFLRDGLLPMACYGDLQFLHSMRELEGHALDVKLKPSGNYECGGWTLSPEMLEFPDANVDKDKLIVELIADLAAKDLLLDKMTFKIERLEKMLASKAQSGKGFSV